MAAPSEVTFEAAAAFETNGEALARNATDLTAMAEPVVEPEREPPEPDAGATEDGPASEAVASEAVASEAVASEAVASEAVDAPGAPPEPGTDASAGTPPPAADAAAPAADAAAPAADAAAGGPPPDVHTPSGARGRARIRRRARYLRRLREVQLRDLGGFMLELRRFGHERPDLVEAKLAGVARTDRELRTLERALGAPVSIRELREAGIGGACERCGAVYGSGDRFCCWCGSPLRRTEPPGGEAAEKR